MSEETRQDGAVQDGQFKTGQDGPVRRKRRAGDPLPGDKTCVMCHRLKSIDQFSKRCYAVSWSSHCKTCTKTRSRCYKATGSSANGAALHFDDETVAWRAGQRNRP